MHSQSGILFSELNAGEIIVVDVEGEGAEAKFTFTGAPKSEHQIHQKILQRLLPPN